MTTTTSLSAVDALKATRNLFAETHWTTGALYEIDGVTGKKHFCMVGGICHVFQRDAWGVDEEPFYIGGMWKSDFTLNDLADATRQKLVSYVDHDTLEEVWRSERELVRTIWPDLCESGRRGTYKVDQDIDDLTPMEIEEAVVDWNDGSIVADEFQQRGNASYVVEKLQETIDRLEAV